ncbi:unnamed protein product [Adineta ricciae]|uniref:Uncharacterized protein n=1 Tax=Adineta ricciae TaxID=249248 RepID=A0A813MB85_ADIRI|nr:unnamed protein product [Adineta ricciae]
MNHTNATISSVLILGGLKKLNDDDDEDDDMQKAIENLITQNNNHDPRLLWHGRFRPVRFVFRPFPCRRNREEL